MKKLFAFNTILLLLCSYCTPSNEDKVYVKGWITEREWEHFTRNSYKIRSFYEFFYEDGIYRNSILQGSSNNILYVGDSICVELTLKDDTLYKSKVHRRFYKSPSIKVTTKFIDDVVDTVRNSYKDEQSWDIIITPSP